MKIIWNDITREPTDVIVTLASRELRPGSGVDKIIHQVAGPDLLECRRQRSKSIAEMSPGKVFFTPAYGLRKTCGAKNVIHIASVLWQGGVHNEDLLLDGCYLKAAVVANALAEGKKTTVSFPVLGSGKYAMPKDRALDVAVRSLKEIGTYFPKMELKLVVVDAVIFDDARNRYPDLCESRFSKEEEDAYRKRFPHPIRADEKVLRDTILGMESGSAYWEGIRTWMLGRNRDFNQLFRFVWECVRERNRKEDKRIKSLNCSLPEDDKYSVCNVKLLAEKSGVPVYTVKHVLEGRIKKLAPEELIPLCVGMHLPVGCVCALMQKLGYSFGETARDRAVIQCLSKDDLGAVKELNHFLKSQGIAQEELFPIDRKSCADGRKARARLPKCKSRPTTKKKVYKRK